MGREYIIIFFAIIYIFILSYSIVSDFRYLLIPNWCSIVLSLGFILYSVFFLTMNDFAWHLLVGAIAFALGIGFYSFGWFGGGDVKLMAAAMLWAGPANAVVYGFAMAVFGWILAFGIIGLRSFLKYFPDAFSGSALLRRPLEWAEEGVCPYGIAIAAAAMVIASPIFSP